MFGFQFKSDCLCFPVSHIGLLVLNNQLEDYVAFSTTFMSDGDKRNKRLAEMSTLYCWLFRQNQMEEHCNSLAALSIILLLCG